MIDGSLSMRRRQPKASEAAASTSRTPQSGAYDFFMGGGSFALGSKGLSSRSKAGKGKQASATGVLDEFRVEKRRQKRLREYDRLLKNFKYAATLDAVLRKVSLMQSNIAHFLRDLYIHAERSSNYYFLPHI
jgi:U3 small nucleolar RNA-associated protein 15